MSDCAPVWLAMPCLDELMVMLISGRSMLSERKSKLLAKLRNVPQLQSLFKNQTYADNANNEVWAAGLDDTNTRHDQSECKNEDPTTLTNAGSQEDTGDKSDGEQEHKFKIECPWYGADCKYGDKCNHRGLPPWKRRRKNGGK